LEFVPSGPGTLSKLVGASFWSGVFALLRMDRAAKAFEAAFEEQLPRNIAIRIIQRKRGLVEVSSRDGLQQR
jgi:hypothetical protein